MKRILMTISAVISVFGAVPAEAHWVRGIFVTDPLAARDDWGLMHQCPVLYRPDFERRNYPTRFTYYFQGRRTLLKDPAYVGALQTSLRRVGYYNGPIDGIYSDDVSEAIARLQKNYCMRVTGNLTVAVRRALHLP